MIALQYHHKAEEGRFDPRRFAVMTADRAHRWRCRSVFSPRGARHPASDSAPGSSSARPGKNALIASARGAAGGAAGRTAAACRVGRRLRAATDEYPPGHVCTPRSFPAQEALVFTGGGSRFGPTSSGPAIGCLRRRGFPTAGLSSSIAALCRSAKQDPSSRGGAARRRGMHRRIALAGDGGAGSPRPSERSRKHVVRPRPATIAAAKAGARWRRSIVDLEAPVPPGGLPQARTAHGQTCATTTCSMR